MVFTVRTTGSGPPASANWKLGHCPPPPGRSSRHEARVGGVGAAAADLVLGERGRAQQPAGDLREDSLLGFVSVGDLAD